MDKSKRRRWKFADMIGWDAKNKAAMRRPLSDESIQSMRELVYFAHNPIRTAITPGTMFGLVLGILRLSIYGYRITAEGHWSESRIVMRPFVHPYKSAPPKLSRIFLAKLRRWGWDNRGGCWVYELSEAYDDPS